MLSIEGAIVTIDAMGCQRDIAKKILEKKADYILALKGNQGILREDVEVFVDEQKAYELQGYHDQPQWTTIDGDHGRIETLNHTVIHDVEWLQDTSQLAGPEICCRGRKQPRNQRQRLSDETRFYLTSLMLLAEPSRPDDLRPLGHRKYPPLGHGHGLSRQARGIRPPPVGHSKQAPAAAATGRRHAASGPAGRRRWVSSPADRM